MAGTWDFRLVVTYTGDTEYKRSQGQASLYHIQNESSPLHGKGVEFTMTSVLMIVNKPGFCI